MKLEWFDKSDGMGAGQDGGVAHFYFYFEWLCEEFYLFCNFFFRFGLALLKLFF